jgi:hypothetical protein
MMTWGMLLGQRRRWNNGTLASFAYFLLDYEGNLQMSMSNISDKNKSLTFAWWLQIYQMAVTTMSPGFFMIALYESFLNFESYFPAVIALMEVHLPAPFDIDVPAKYYAPMFFFSDYIIWVTMCATLGKKPTW